MLLPKLVFSNLARRKGRVALAVAAIALSVSLVVSVTSGYTSIEAAAYQFFTNYLGSTDVTIANVNYGGGAPETLLAKLDADPLVKHATGRFDTEDSLPGPASKWAELIGIRPDDPQIGQMYFESGWWFNSADGDVVVIDEGAAQAIHAAVGDTITLPALGHQDLKVKVVGIVHKPELMASFRPTLYLPLHTLQKFKGAPGLVTKITVELKNHSDVAEFEAQWKPRLAKIDPNLHLRTAGDSRAILQQNLQALHLLSYMGGLIAMVTATFIVFSTLSMGVSERQRTLAMLRAVGAFKLQIAGLVILEGILLAAIGSAAGVGLGILWVHLLVWKFSKLFLAGAALSYGGIAFGAIGSIVAALLASILPAWSASRVSPLEAMTPLADAGRARVPWICGIIGLALIAIDPLVLYGPTQKLLAAAGATAPREMVRVIAFYSHFTIGLPAILLGFFLLAPVLIWLVEGLLGPLVAGIMGLRFELLRQQLSSGIWRAAGTGAALMVGLAILVALQVEGRSAINGWNLPNKFPDIFIVDFSGIPLSQAPKLQDIPGIRKGQIMPIAIVSPGLPKNFLGMGEMSQVAGMMMMPDRTMFIGIDPNIAFKMIELEFRQGNVAEAQRELKLGDHVLVTSEFMRLKGLGVGDKLPLKTDLGWKNFIIAGVVWSPGIDVMVTAFDLGRQMEQRTTASVFGTIADAKKYFGVDKFILFAANLKTTADKDAVLKEVQHSLKAQGMRGGDVRKLKAKIETNLKNFLLLVSTVAFAAMGVASLGVANTIMASIRTRRWQLGILRSIGVTRSQLLRLVIAEAILLGIVGCALGVPAGLLMSVDAQAVQAAVTGYAPPLLIPWGFVALGMAIILAVSVLASLWPAAMVARAPTLELLQAGRASA